MVIDRSAETTTPYASLLRPLDDVPAVPGRLAEALGDGSAPPPPQEGMRWTREPWARRLSAVPDIDDFLASLPSTVDRATIVTSVRDSEGAGRTDLAFVAAMIWGYGSSGYGAYRTARVLTGGSDEVDQSVLERLRSGARTAREEGALSGFYAMRNRPGRVAYLGPAFFTKWLYFATATTGPDSADAAPVLDMRVRDWIATNAEVQLRLDKTWGYHRYLQLLDAWSVRPTGTLSRATVERVIFSLS
ncbi:hypothetical protein [Cellulosimicrobium sp. CpK407]|uniref:8-oxoguanine DNA glycosylase OGG fold protein n=1 Tax=Cellulosimicrobium sp. CpK407 TaxID=3229847 RepID=UPI003F2F97B9